MECLVLALGIQPSEQAQRLVLRGRREGEHRNICLLARFFNLVVDHVIGVGVGLVAGTKGLSDSLHIFAGSGRMGLVNDDSELLVLQVGHRIHNIGELLDGSGDDLGIVGQLIGQICRCTPVIHDPDQAGLVVHPQNGFLELTVHHHTVGHNNDVVKDHPVVGVVERSQPIGQPGDAVGFAGTG